MRVRRKPIELEAWQFLPGHQPQIIPEWIRPEWFCEIIELDERGYQRRGQQVLEIPTLEGTMRAKKGDWIIQGVKGEVWLCRPDIFYMTYEFVV